MTRHGMVLRRVTGPVAQFKLSGLAACARVGRGMQIHAYWFSERTSDGRPQTLCDKAASEVVGDYALRIALPFDRCQTCESAWNRLTRGGAA